MNEEQKNNLNAEELQKLIDEAEKGSIMNKQKIDGYHGIYNGIKYYWHDKESYAVISFIYDGIVLSRDVGNITGPDFDMGIIDVVSEIEVNLAIEAYEIEKKAKELLAKER